MLLLSERHSGVMVLGGVCTALLLGPTPALAASPIASDDVFASPTVVDFNSLPFGELTDPNVLLASEGILFPSLAGESVVDFGDSNKLIDITGTGDGSDGQIIIEFDTPVAAVGVDFWSSSDLTFTAYDASDTAVGTAKSSSSSGFFGVDGEGTDIARIMINDHAWGFQIDNLTTGSIAVAAAPAPGAALLAAFGLGLVGLIRRRFAQ